MSRHLVIPLFAVALLGCSIDPGATWAPDMLKDKTGVAPQPEPAPDIRNLLTTRLPEFFMPAAAPSAISFSPPLQAGGAWETCIRATVNGAMGNSIGQQTYIVTILHNKVFRQEKAATSHWCERATFEAL